MVLSHYDILGVSDTASKEEISKAYKNMAKKLHPDMNPGSNHALFSQANLAREVLMDDAKRAEYDRTLKDGSEPQESPQEDYPRQDAQSSDYPKPGRSEGYSGRSRRTYSYSDDPTIEFEGFTQKKVSLTNYGWYEDLFNKKKSDGSPVEEYIEKTPLMSTLHRWVIGIVAVLYVATIVVSLLSDHSVILAGLVLLNGIFTIIYYVRYAMYAKDRSFYLIGALWMLGTVLLSFYAGRDNGGMASTGLMIALLCAYFVLALFMYVKRSGRLGGNDYPLRSFKSDRTLLMENDTFGVPGDLSSAEDKFSKDALIKGTVGELYTATILDEFAKLPGAKVYYGLRFPGSKEADVDACIVYKNTMIMVDAKQWSDGSYTFMGNGANQSFVNGRDSIFRDVHMDIAVERFRSYTPSHVKVYGIIMVNGGDLTVKNPYECRGGCYMGDSTQATDVIGQILQEAKGTDGYADLRNNMYVLHRMK